jgi:mitochondrial fission protein ELM1
MRPVVVLLLSDGIPGHFRQSEGVVAAIARQRPVTLHRLDLPPPSALGRVALNLVAPRVPALFPDPVLFAGRALPPRPVDLVVSAGGRTLAANVRAARIYGCPNLFSGSPRRFGYGAFARVLQIYPRPDPPPSCRLVLKPSPVDPDGAPPPRPLAAASDADPARIAVLVGGPVPHADFAEADWRALADLLRATARAAPVRFVLSTSRRTPDAALDHLGPVARDPAVVGEWIDWRTAGPGSIGRALAADAVAVTADSMSMISEAVAMRRPTVVLDPAVRTASRDDAALDPLLAAGAARRLALAAAGPADLLAALAATTPMPGNPLDALDAAVADLLPPEGEGAA